jgi:hypothetical protein
MLRQHRSTAANISATWLQANAANMIRCPSQPGGLLISARACARRYFLAQAVPSNPAQENLFTFTINQNLRACRECAVGRRQTKRQVA